MTETLQKKAARAVRSGAVILASLSVLAAVPVAGLAQTASVPPGMAQGMPAGELPPGMPDPHVMSGIPMPVSDLPEGSIAVRVVREEINNNIRGQVVELTAGGRTLTATTDDEGRAQFGNIAPGTTVQAATTVEGERIESQTFPMPSGGGVRMLLVASGEGGAKKTPSAAPVPGSVSFGPNSRFVIEFDDDTLSVFYLLEIVNPKDSPVNPASPVTFALPADAIGPALLEGSSRQAEVNGHSVLVTGPFNPGSTVVQVAYQLAPSGSERTIEQRFPIPLDALSLAVQKPGALQVTSPQLTMQRDVPADGKMYIEAAGPAVVAGRPVTIELANLPHRSSMPAAASLVLALLVMAAGAWLAIGGSQKAAVKGRREELENRRERLFGELARLEGSRRSGNVDATQYEERRERLMADLERIYAELDNAAVSGTPRPPEGSGRGMAA